MANPYEMRSAVQNLFDVLGSRKKLVHWNTVGVDTIDGITTITWRPRAPGLLFEMSGDSIDDYPMWVRSNAYSAMLFDGSLLQLTWKLAGGEVVGHRLAYIPCPLRLDEELLATEPILDVWSLAKDGLDANLVLRSAIRFDYDPVAAVQAGFLHPASHLTLNHVECRIPVAYPLGLEEFCRFIFMHFYPDLWEDIEYLRRLKPRFKGKTWALHPDHLNEVHIRWD